MNPFIPLLKKMNKKLDLPQPVKSRIILEIASDIKDAYDDLLTQGMNKREAIIQIHEKFDLTDESIKELQQIHRPVFNRLMDRLSDQARNRNEKIILILMLISLSFISVKTILTTPFFQEASIYIYPALAIFTAILLQTGYKCFQYFIKKDHRIHTLRKGLNTLLYLGGGTLILGVTGFVLALYTSKLKILLLGPFFFISLGKSQILLKNGVTWLIENTALMMICLMVAILAALFWFLLANKASSIEQAEAAILLEE